MGPDASMAHWRRFLVGFLASVGAAAAPAASAAGALSSAAAGASALGASLASWARRLGAGISPRYASAATAKSAQAPERRTHDDPLSTRAIDEPSPSATAIAVEISPRPGLSRRPVARDGPPTILGPGRSR